MDNLDPSFGGNGNTEHLAANLGGGIHGVFDPFAPITGASTVLPKDLPAEVWEPQLPAPGEPPDAGSIRHPKYGAAVHRWVYRDAAGVPLFAVARFEFAHDCGKFGKAVYPYTFGRRQWTTQAGRHLDETRWHLKRPAVPVPLYGMDRLAARPDAVAILCEGEKAADAAGQMFPDLVVIAAQGGCAAPEKSDWSTVAGRNVIVWPDADVSGLRFAAMAAELMYEAGAQTVRVVQIVPAEWPEGWDLADTLPPDMPVERLTELLDAAQAPTVDGDEPADDATATSGGNVTPMALERAYRLDDLVFATQRDALAKDLGITATDLTTLRRKHFAQMRDEQRVAEKAATQSAKEQKERAKIEKAQRAADAKTSAERAKLDWTWKTAEAQADLRAKPVPETEGTAWPFGIEERDDGLYYAALPDDAPPLWLCEPVEVLGMARDADGEAWGLWLRWHDVDKRPHTWSMPNRLLMSRPGELEAELVDRGFRIDTNFQQRGYLRHALGGVKTGARVTLATAPGWSTPATGAAAYALINGEVIGAPDEQIVLKTPPENAAAKMRQSGDLAEWKAQVAGLAAGNPVAMFAICTAFTGPLLGPLGESSGGVHIFGRSKTGKTLAVRLGLSAWGPANKSGLLRDWRSTANALESAAEEANDSLLTLDEVHQADPRDVVAAVYQLANESGKSRLRQDASAKRRRTWRTVVLSNGELDIAAMAAKAAQILPAGAEVRLPSIPIDGQSMWPNLHGFSSATELMAALQKALQTQFGTAIRPFLTKLAESLKTGEPNLELALDESRTRISANLPENADDQVREVSRRFALIALAGELAIDWGILPWEPMAADKAVAKILAWWIERRGGVGSTEEHQHVKLVRAFLSEYGPSRFVALDRVSNQNGELVEPRQWIERQSDRPIVSRMGWRRIMLDRQPPEYLFTRDGWAEICATGGADPTEVARTLKAVGILDPGENSNLAKKVRIPILGPTRCFVIKGSIFATSNDGTVIEDEAWEPVAK